MKQVLLTSLSVLALLNFSACKVNQAGNSEHNSRNSVDWLGVYKSQTDENQTTVITLHDDLTYNVQTATGAEAENPSESKGTFTWNKAGSHITLENKNKEKVEYKVGENILFDKNDKPVFAKIQAENITEKYWKLIELNGQAISFTEGMHSEPHFILKEEDHRVIGSGGCNRLMGSYELQPENLRISFGQIASTMMACMDMSTEDQFFKVLELADNYSLSADGTQLSLNKARMAPLARFEVVYLK